MADADRKSRNVRKMREIISLLETRLYDTLGRANHFDMEVRFSVKDSSIQDSIDVHVRYKDRLDDSRQ